MQLTLLNVIELNIFENKNKFVHHNFLISVNKDKFFFFLLLENNYK